MKFSVLLTLVAGIYAKSCGLGGLDIVKATHNGKEYAYVSGIYAPVNYAERWCRDYLDSEEFGFPFGDLLRPTTEELIFVRENLIPNPSVEFNTGYRKSQSSTIYTPEAYGIVSGHGVDARNHWVRGEPNDHLGVVYSTNQYRVNPTTGENIPLFATSYVNDIRPFICVRQVTKEFPSNMGFYNDDFDCNYITKKISTGRLDYAVVPQEKTFEEAMEICENLDSEGFPNGRLTVLNQNDVNTVRNSLLPGQKFWNAYRYSESRGDYINSHNRIRTIYFLDWNENEPSAGDCVVAGYSPGFPYGPFESEDCNAKYVFACERVVKKKTAIIKRTFNGKEYAMRNRLMHYDGSQTECDFILPGSYLARPTKEELIYIEENVIPGKYPIWLGYDIKYDREVATYTPADYGITEGMYGDSLLHWVNGQPNCNGAISVTTQFRVDRETGESIPLLTCSPYYADFFYVCEREVSAVNRSMPIEVEPNVKNEDYLLIFGAGMFIVGSLFLAFAVAFRFKNKSPTEETIKHTTVVEYEHTL